MKNFARWFASLPITLVAAHSIMLGIVLSAAEWDGWISWGHEASIVMIAPIIAWVLFQRPRK